MWGYLDDPRLFFVLCWCSWVPCLFWTVELSTVLQTNPPRSVDSAVFSSNFFAYLNLPAVTVWFWDPSFPHWGHLIWLKTKLLKKVQTVHWCSRRKTRCINKWLLKLLNRRKISNFFFCWNIYFFPLLLPFESKEDTCMFPGRQIKYNYLDLQIQKVLPPALNASCVLLEHQWMFEPFLIVVFESINCPQCEKDGSQNHTVTAGKVQICKNAGKLQNLQNVEDLSEEQCSVQLFKTNKGLMNNQHKTKEHSWIIPQVTSHSIKNQGFPNFEGVIWIISAYFFVLWTICKHILCKISYSGQY